MRLSSETVTNAFNLRRSKELVIKCIASKKDFVSINEAILKCNKNSKVIVESNNFNIEGLLISLSVVNIENELDIERELIQGKKNKTIILDVYDINLSIEKRNLALGFLSRYNIDIIKGYRKDILALINGQKSYKSLQVDKYRDFSRKNNIIIVIDDENYWITDGYSEFIINKEELLLYDDKNINNINNILSGIMIANTALYEEKEQKIEAVLLAINIFEICKKVALDKVKNEGNNQYLENYLIEEILSVSSDKIYKLSNIGYKFKR